MSATTHLTREPLTTTPQTSVVTSVRFGCPRCGDDRDGVHVATVDDDAWVECGTCGYRTDPGVLDIPSPELLGQWYALALRHGRAALLGADDSVMCSQLATAWCRRLADELTPVGKIGYLDRLARPLPTSPTARQRAVLVELGVALRMPAAPLNALLDRL